MPGDRKSTSERIRLAERRRQALFLFSIRRLTVPEIAQVLEVSERTITRDLKWARERAREQLEREADSAERVSDLAQDIDANYVAACREAWAAFYASNATAPARIRALNAVITATERRAEHLRALGLLRRVPESVELGLNLFGMTDEELAAEIAAKETSDGITQAKRGSGGSEGDPDLAR